MESHCCKSSEVVTATAVTLRWTVHDWSADVRVVASQTMAEPRSGASPPTKIHARLLHENTLYSRAMRRPHSSGSCITKRDLRPKDEEDNNTLHTTRKMLPMRTLEVESKAKIRWRTKAALLHSKSYLYWSHAVRLRHHRDAGCGHGDNCSRYIQGSETHRATPRLRTITPIGV